MNQQESAQRLKEMQRLYEKERLTLEQIGAHFGITRQAVYERFKRAGIKVRSKKRPRFTLDRETLVRLYETEKRTIIEIARILKISMRKISQELDRHGIEKRSNQYSKRKYLELYEMKVGDQIVIPRPLVSQPRQRLSAKSKEIGIRISVRNFGDDSFQITRVS